MPNNINLPTYEQVENVGQAVESIETVVNNGVGTKWEDYSPLTTVVQASVSATEVELFNVSGEGFFKRIALTSSASSDYTAKVFIDGVLFRTFAVTNAVITGIFGIEYLFYDANGIRSFVQMDSSTSVATRSLPSMVYGHYPSSKSAGMTLISEPIFFKNSLVITVFKDSGTANVFLNLEGGIK